MLPPPLPAPPTPPPPLPPPPPTPPLPLPLQCPTLEEVLYLTISAFVEFLTFFSTDRPTDRLTDRPRRVDTEAPIPELKKQKFLLELWTFLKSPISASKTFLFAPVEYFEVSCFKPEVSWLNPVSLLKGFNI